MRVRWLTAFLDTPRGTPRGAEAEEFWLAVTSSTLSPRRGGRQEFATLQPPDGDAYLRVQHTDAGELDCHLDVHVADVHRSAERALRAGALVTAELADLVVARTPAGFRFCLSAGPERRRPAPLPGPGGSASLVDQLCIDVPPDSFDAELRWWSELFGWTPHPTARPEFTRLDVPPELPLRLLFQRLADPGPGHPTAHLDLACTDRAGEVSRHLRLGATQTLSTEHWDAMRDPAGRAYCLTVRDPYTGTH